MLFSSIQEVHSSCIQLTTIQHNHNFINSIQPNMLQQLDNLIQVAGFFFIQLSKWQFEAKTINQNTPIRNKNEHFFFFFCKNLYFIQRNDEWTLNTERMRNDYKFNLERKHNTKIQGFISFFYRIRRFSSFEV